MDLRTKLSDPNHAVLFYGTTPPRLGASPETIRAAAEKLVSRVEPLPIDGIIVYDIQDEAGRTNLPRPFAFTRTVDPREHSLRLTQLSQRPALTYKCVGDLGAEGFEAWLTESARDYRVKFVSIVGRPTSGSDERLPLSRAIRMAAEHPAGFAVGGVMIAERHRPERSEASRLIAKSREGCGYFVSQTVYQADKTIALLRDYLRECEALGVAPCRIVLTFAPCGREKTMSFIKWLGVQVPDAVERRIFSARDPLSESVAVCVDNLKQILDQDYVGKVPLGLNVESVSINRDEIDKTVELFESLLSVFQARKLTNGS